MSLRPTLSRGRAARSWSLPLRPVLAVLALWLASALAPASAYALHPANDAFYVAPADLAAYAPGAVIRSREVRVRSIHGVMPYRAFQVLYRTADRLDAPIATVATIMLPRFKSSANRRLVSYQTAYDGLSPTCRPSYSLQAGHVLLQGTETLAIAILLERGWTVVTADYEGPYDHWGVAATSAHGVLDGVRAAESFAPAGLEGAQTKVGLMGYSGGGNATGWASERAATYAPELQIVGAVQGGVAPDLGNLVRTFDGTLYSGIALAGIAGITAAYPELNFDSHLNAAGRSAFKTLRSRPGSCIGDFVLRFPGVRLDSLTTAPGLLDDPAMAAVAEEQSLGKSIPQPPTMWLASTADEMKSYRLVRALAGQYCRAGIPQRFVSTDRVEHIMQFSWTPFLGGDWLAGRFAGTPPRSDCAKIG